MPDTANKSHGTQPPPPRRPHPRRASPENSVTLRHHRLAREASLRPNSSRSRVSGDSTSSPRRNSSGDSHDTGQSDPNKWFDQSNLNPTANYDSNAMDVDPPFYQKESDSSNEGGKAVYRYDPTVPMIKPTVTHSSSADDYRSVIDDLTVEIQRLKEELKRYKQFGSDVVKDEKLFEIKVHGLPKRKKRELEATLRDFAASLAGTSSVEASASSQKKKSSRHVNRLYSSSGSMSKHASSSTGSQSRPVDSAYASMSTGHNSSGTSLGRPSMSSRAKSSEQKVESYLRDIPEGLYPRHMIMTDKERKKLVVRRLEQIFTGKMASRKNQGSAYPVTSLTPVTSEATQGRPAAVHQPPPLAGMELSREARILPLDSNKKSRSRDNVSTSNSNGENGDQTESGGNSGGAHSGSNTSPPIAPPPEQRPTRPRDLDPDRVQVPSENMEYLRHLGLVPPELLSHGQSRVGGVVGMGGVAPDEDGSIHLNLLCNLAQLHILNVTPDFIRSAVSEKSTKFQLSPDGRKIRWRGGVDGTRFSSDSSGDNSQRSPMDDEPDAWNRDGQRKRQKKDNGDDKTNSAPSSKLASKYDRQVSQSSDSFHYKPMFAHHSSSHETSLGDTGSSFGQADDSNQDDSRWGLSGSGSSQQRKRRVDGAIIYYSGAPFCTDLSGDPGDAATDGTGEPGGGISPATYMANQTTGQPAAPPRLTRRIPIRSGSGSFLPRRPLSDGPAPDDGDVPMAGSDEAVNCDDIDMTLPWSDSQQRLDVRPLEPSGLGGVLPDDHFMVVVATKRPRAEEPAKPPLVRRSVSDETARTTDSIVSLLASMSTSRDIPPSQNRMQTTARRVEIEYLSGRIKRLNPNPLPPPAIFFPPFSTDSSNNSLDLGSDADDTDSTQEFMSRRANPHQSDNEYPDDVDLSSGDEAGEEPDDDMAMDDEEDGDDEADVDGSEEAIANARRKENALKAAERGAQASGRGAPAPGAAGVARPALVRGVSKSGSIGAVRRTGSLAATAGGEESGYSSSAEES